MSIPNGQLIVLDTNVLVHLVRGNEFGERIDGEYDLSSRAERPLFSTISEGEILGLAKLPKWKWGKRKLETLQGLLDQLVRVDAGHPEVVARYSELYATSMSSGNPTGDNDLWSAATASATGAVLLTTDSDFRWMQPPLVMVEYYDLNEPR